MDHLSSCFSVISNCICATITYIFVSIKLCLKWHCELLYKWLLFFAVMGGLGYIGYYYGKSYIHWSTAPDSKLVCGEGLQLRGSVCVSNNAVVETPLLRETDGG